MSTNIITNDERKERSERSELMKIINMINFIKDHSLKDISDKYTPNIDRSINVCDKKLFVKALFKQIDLQFIPLYVVAYIGNVYFNITPRDYSHYIEFIKNNQQIFIILHEELRKKKFQKQSRDENYYIERVNQILLEEAHIERDKPLNSKSLIKAIYDRIYHFPYLPNVSYMLKFYEDNIQPNSYQSYAKPMPKITMPNEKIKQIKRLPWKSKMKVDDYMKQNKWTEIQKEVARDYLLYDSFNEKKNRKYQLKAVAPRHTLIIDLFYANHFTYLLAINVNTRKAFAIPSPQIKPIQSSPPSQTAQHFPSYLVPKTKHKDKDNVIDMLTQLLKQTPIKMIICDQERSFISDKFEQFCANKGIRLHYYVINNIRDEYTGKDNRMIIHNSLAILDRFCRTLRNMAYNIGVIDQEIDPNLMSKLINIYNNSPHTTFYRILKKAITPNEMDKNKLLEDKLCYQLVRHNFVVRNRDDYDISINSPVRIKNEANTFDKLKHKLLPGIYEVIGRDNNLFICKQGKNIVRVPRYMIKPL